MFGRDSQLAEASCCGLGGENQIQPDPGPGVRSERGLAGHPPHSPLLSRVLELGECR